VPQASLFTHGIFRNPVTLYGVSVSVAVMVIVVYAPFLQVCWRGMCCQALILLLLPSVTVMRVACTCH
jgi:hypothetical protein